MKRIFLTLTLLAFSACVDPAKLDNKSQVVKTMAQQIVQKNRDIPHLDVEKTILLMEQRPQTTVFLDVRTAGERSISTLPGALSIDDFLKSPQAYKNKTIIVYCTLGSRSSKFIRPYLKQDFRMFSLAGGVLAWAQANEEFVQNGVKTKNVHVNKEAFNLIPNEYKAHYE